MKVAQYPKVATASELSSRQPYVQSSGSMPVEVTCLLDVLARIEARRQARLRNSRKEEQ